MSKDEIGGDEVTLFGEKARYLISVLRCSIGDGLKVFDGAGGVYEAEISYVDSKKVTINLLEKVSYNTESPLNLVLIQGILKGEKMDWIIQKATELGIKEIIPAITERSQIRKTRKAERWRKIAEEASRQSGRTKVPVIHEPVEFSSWIMSYGQSSLNGFIFWEEGGISLKEAVKMGTGDWGLGLSSSTNPQSLNPDPSLFIAIGPEGGFTKKEVELANTKGLLTVSLGKRILRAETAAISAITLVQFLAGDM